MSAEEVGKGVWKVLSVMFKPPKQAEWKKKTTCAIYPYSPALLSAQALSDLEIV